jgi:hypothetical protein
MSIRCWTSAGRRATASLAASQVRRRHRILVIRPTGAPQNRSTAYRADLAHRATERRARQRMRATSRGAQTPPQAHLWYQSMIASARSTADLVDTARQGVTVLGPDTPAGARLENVARFLGLVSESLTRAAEQAREILYTKPETRESDGQ